MPSTVTVKQDIPLKYLTILSDKSALASIYIPGMVWLRKDLKIEGHGSLALAVPVQWPLEMVSGALTSRLDNMSHPKTRLH